MDPRLAFLLRAAAKLILVESCHLDLDTAFADLVPATASKPVDMLPSETMAPRMVLGRSAAAGR